MNGYAKRIQTLLTHAQINIVTKLAIEIHM